MYSLWQCVTCLLWSCVYRQTLFIPQMENCLFHFGTYDFLVVVSSMAISMRKLFLLLRDSLVRIMKLSISFLKVVIFFFFFVALGKLAGSDPHSNSFKTWIKFLFKGPTRYIPPPLRQNRKRISGKSRTTCNRTGYIDKKIWSSKYGAEEQKIWGKKHIWQHSCPAGFANFFFLEKRVVAFVQVCLNLQV